MSTITPIAEERTVSATGHRFHLECVWPVPVEEVRQDVIRFWQEEGALPAPVAQDRARELLVVARDTEGRVVGVSTAVRDAIVQLGFDCFYYRTFVGKSARTRGLRSTELVWDILRESYRVLNQRFAAGHDRQVLGIFAEIENPSIMRNCREATWRDQGMNFVFIGRSPEGKQRRAWYFEGAQIP